jgi:predicted transposase YdaD
MAMSKPFDATMRKLIELEPAAWLRFLHIPVTNPERVLVIDSNLSTVTADADKVLLVDEPLPWIEHVELQAGRDTELPDRVHGYSTLLRRSHKMPVHTTIVLLRPAADGSELTGTHELRDRHGDVYDWFRYDVVRLWRQLVQEILAAGLAVLPLAPVADVPAEKIPEVLVAISERMTTESSPDQAATIWAATKILLGLRYSIEQVEEMVRGVSAMILGIRGIEESSVYQDIFAKGEAKGLSEGRVEGRAEGLTEGRIEEARRVMQELGSKKFGEPEEAVRARIIAIDDVDQLNALLARILDVATWDELLRPL